MSSSTIEDYIREIDYGPPYGFPVRRFGSCPEYEEDCGPSLHGIHACCPGETVCPGRDERYYNNVCCPNRGNCTEPLVASPHCANNTAALFDSDGYFCCLPGEKGFVTADNIVGCAVNPTNDGWTPLKPISLPVTTSTVPLTSSPTTDPTTSTSVPTETPISDSSDNETSTGAIVGGVVGGVVGLATIIALVWFVMRRRRRRQSAQRSVETTGGVAEVKPPAELSEYSVPPELPAENSLVELPANRMST